jgi:hypothetical protein
MYLSRLPVSHSSSPGSVLGHVVWDLSWVNRHKSRFSRVVWFPCQFSFHRLLHAHHYRPRVGTIGQTVADVPSELGLTLPHKIKHNIATLIRFVRREAFLRLKPICIFSSLNVSITWNAKLRRQSRYSTQQHLVHFYITVCSAYSANLALWSCFSGLIYTEIVLSVWRQANGRRQIRWEEVINGNQWRD